MEPITLLVGGGLLAFGYITGRVHRRKKTPKPPKAVCGCKHGLHAHDKDGCHATVEVESQWDWAGSPIGWVRKPCACVKYIGPIPAEDFISMPILPPRDGD